MKKEKIYGLVENSLNGNKSTYIRFLNEFANELKIEGYSDMHDSIKNIINKNTIVNFSASNSQDGGLLDSLVKKPHEVDVLIEGIKMGMIKSAFFYGDPGTGKTYFAKELSEMTNFELKKLSVSEILDSKLGESIKNLEVFFKKNTAERKIIFIDEADALFTKRGNKNDVFEMERLLTSMLQIMDNNRNAVIIFASNLINRIDTAILRRFDILIDFDRFIVDIDKALKNSRVLMQWPITDHEKSELRDIIKGIRLLRISDIDLIARKYIILKKLELKKGEDGVMKKYINEINDRRENGK